jgi:hypothetical protein
MRRPSGRSAILASQLELHLDRALHRIDRTGELDEQAIAGGSDDASVELGNLWREHLVSKPPEPAQGARFIGRH